jgi:hypothetical protein
MPAGVPFISLDNFERAQSLAFAIRKTFAASREKSVICMEPVAPVES